MSLIEEFIDKAKSLNKRVVLPEGKDERIIEAASRLATEGICKPIVLANAEDAAKLAPGKPLDGIQFVDPKAFPDVERYAESYAKVRGVEPGVAMRLVKRDLMLGAMMVAEGDADAMVAGVAKATAQVISAAALCIGFAEGITQASSFFLMVLPDGRVLVFADCAVVIEPSAKELAEIAVVTARNAAKMLGTESKVAMLSFSTRGSATHAKVDFVKEATKIAREMAPELTIDGEMQADAAIVESVGKKKAPDSPLGGQANVLVFPDLNAANIGYKLVQRLANAKAIGPVMQGFAKPVNDLSRGASVDDVVAVSAIASLQAQ